MKENLHHTAHCAYTPGWMFSIQYHLYRYPPNRVLYLHLIDAKNSKSTFLAQWIPPDYYN